MRWLCTNDKI